MRFIDPDGRQSRAGIMLDQSNRAFLRGDITQEQLLGRYKANADGALIGISVVTGVGEAAAVAGALRGAGRILVRQAGKRLVAKSATQIARDGGRHAGQLKQFLKQSPEQLQKTIKSFDKQITKHEGWVENPTSKVKNFDRLRPEHQQNLRHHWRQDVDRHKELKSIAQDVLRGE